MKLSSSDFEDGGDLAEKFTCAGEGIRPALAWSEIPSETKSLAISLVNPDAPSGNFVHWLAVNIPITTSSIISSDKVSLEMPNHTGGATYVPPCPPSGKHRYIFTLYALDADKIDASSLESFLDTTGAQT